MDQELYHHGTKGMKWGVRRYQNPDGSLTPAGRKRYAKSDKFRAKVDAQEARAKLRKQLDDNAESAAKKVKTMSDDDIRTAINRKKLEKEYLGMYDDKRRYKNKSPGDLTDEELNAGIERANTEKKYREAYPKQTSFISKFAKSAVKDVIAPAVRENAKNLLSNYLKKKVDEYLKEPPKEKTELEKLKEHEEKLRVLDSIANYKDKSKKRERTELDDLLDKEKKSKAMRNIKSHEAALNKDNGNQKHTLQSASNRKTGKRFKARRSK